MPRKKSSSNSTTVDNRARAWTFIVYPESAPQQWRDVLDEEHIAWIESPLHDKDLNATGEPKKPHRHILLLFEGKKSFEQIKEITDKLIAPIPQKCASAKALVRYMAHLDNPEKAQYDKNLIVAHGGADLDALFAPTTSQRYQYIKEMIDCIVQNDVTEFEDILIYAMTDHYEDWFPLLCDSCAIVISKFLSSRRHRKPEIPEPAYMANKKIEAKSDVTATVNPETCEATTKPDEVKLVETTSSETVIPDIETNEKKISGRGKEVEKVTSSEVGDVPPTDTNSASDDTSLP